MTAAVVVVGSCNVDLLATGGALPGPGETTLFERLDTVPGGKGLNQAIAAARAGATCALIGAVGADAHGALLRAAVESAGVDTALLRTVEGPSGTALIMVGTGGENLIGVVPGANGSVLTLGPKDHAALDGPGVLMLQLEIPLATVVAAARAARAGGRVVLLNAAPYRYLSDELLDNVDVLLVNEHVAAALGRRTPPVRITVTTLGARGARYLEDGAEAVLVPAPPTTALDATAAGDTFAGYLAAALAAGESMEEAVGRACAAASISVERLGASSSIPTRAEVEVRLQAR